jgi:hypothetical protein
MVFKGMLARVEQTMRLEPTAAVEILRDSFTMLEMEA